MSQSATARSLPMTEEETAEGDNDRGHHHLYLRSLLIRSPVKYQTKMGLNMTLKKIIAVLTVTAATVFGGLVFSAHAVTYVYDSLNRLTQVHFDDSTWIQYTYDDVGNPTGKTYYNEFFPITVSAGSGGSVSPSSASVIYEGSQTFTITPNTGYYIAGVSVDGAGQGAITSYTFNNVTAAHSISATFAIYTYTVTPSAGTGGSISPSTPQTVNYDGTTSFTVTPSTGYGISSVTGCGGTLSGNAYTTGPITGNCGVSAAFVNYPVINTRTNAGYSHLQNAYNAAQNGDTILAQSVTLTENFTANLNISVTIVGGYNSNFSANPNTTTIQGAPVISSGTVTWENFVISN